MADRAALEQLRGQRFFANWDTFVLPDRVAAAEAGLRKLIDDVLAPGPALSEDSARCAAGECVQRFNELDQDEPWIFTIEREDICDQIYRVVELCGFECDEDWVGDRDW